MKIILGANKDHEKRTDMVKSVPLTCVINPTLVVNVGTTAEGVVQHIDVDRGDRVKQGQVLVRLESSLQQLEVNIAKARSDNQAVIQTNQARLEFSERRLTRTQELHASEISSQSELDEAETGKLLAELELVESIDTQSIAELEVEQAKAELHLRTVKSPIQGIVLERFVNPGELVKGEPMLRLAQLDPLQVEVWAPLSLLGKLSHGTQATITPLTDVVEEFIATVRVIDRLVDTATNTFGVRLELPNPEYRIPAGLRCQLQFLVEERQQ